MDLLKLTEGEICLKNLKNKNKGINKCSLKKRKEEEGEKDFITSTAATELLGN